MSDLLRDWRIVEVDDAWDLELDIDGPAQLTLDEGGRGELCFFLLEASVDAREVEGRLEFSWELGEMSGRGVATLGNDDKLTIHLLDPLRRRDNASRQGLTSNGRRRRAHPVAKSQVDLL